MIKLHPTVGPCCIVLRVSNLFLKFFLVYGVLGSYFGPLVVFCHTQALKIGPTFHCISNSGVKYETSRCTFANSPITILSLIRTLTVDISIRAQSLAYRNQFHSLFATSTVSPCNLNLPFVRHRSASHFTVYDLF